MTVLLDINVVIDDLINREPFAKNAHTTLELCAGKEIKGYLAGYTLPTIFYILRKTYSTAEIKNMLRSLCVFLDIVDLDKSKYIQALENENFKDFEDSLQLECAKAANADYIVTRNTADFSASSIPPISPENFLRLLEKK
jgi:predicted nucleic acid-binding protein